MITKLIKKWIKCITKPAVSETYLGTRKAIKAVRYEPHSSSIPTGVRLNARARTSRMQPV